MKEHNDIDWEMFELLEGGMTAEQADELLAKIESNEELSAEWNLLQNTKLQEPVLVYNRKKDLLKKETRFIAFAAFSWAKAASIAAALIIALPVGWYLLQNQSEIQISSNVSESMPETTVPKDLPSIEQSNDAIVNVTEEIPTITQPEKTSKGLKTPMVDLGQKNNQPIEKIEERNIEYVSIGSVAPAMNLTTKAPALKELNMVLISTEVDYLVPQKGVDPGFKGIRPTINAGLALLTLPFKDSKIELKPTDNKTLRIEYKSNQYEASAMLSLKPFKN